MVSCLQGHLGADAEKRHVRPGVHHSEDVYQTTSMLFTLGTHSVTCSFVFSAQHHPKHALQSVPRLYTGNGQVKTHMTYSSFCSPHHFFHFPFRHLLSLFTTHDTFAFGILLIKTGCRRLRIQCCTVVDVSTQFAPLIPLLYFPPLLRKLSSSFLPALTAQWKVLDEFFHWLQHEIQMLLFRNGYFYLSV